MAKKPSFSNLSLGSEDLKTGLELLNKDSKPSSFNPLKDNGKSKKTGARPSKVRPRQISSKLHEIKEEKPEKEIVEEPVVKAKAEPKPKQKPQEPKPTENKQSRVGERPVSKPTPKEKVIPQSLPEELPEDFRSHTLLVSEEQLDKLRQKVYMIKASGNRKYSIKDAFYEAFRSYLEGRVEVEEFPEDFVTYSPSLSMGQWEEMNSAMYQVKATTNPKYAMKYAVHEAIEQYLKSS